MLKPKIVPEKVTRPIQLQACWLVGLILVNGAFLAGARLIEQPAWVPGLLVIAAVLNVPIFLGCYFVLQTKFRAEMQEDSYYSKYIGSSVANINVSYDPETNTLRVAERVVSVLGEVQGGAQQQLEARNAVSEVLLEEEAIRLATVHSSSRSLSVLYLQTQDWKQFVEKWVDHGEFHDEISELHLDGLIVKGYPAYIGITLTSLGSKVAERLSKDNLLYDQRMPQELNS